MYGNLVKLCLWGVTFKFEFLIKNNKIKTFDNGWCALKMGQEAI